MSTVTVVSGLPRSGTSLMMQMLAAGGHPVLADATRGPDHDNPRGYYEFEPVKRTRADAGWVADAAGKAVKVVHLLLPALPEDHTYRVIFMKRDLDEVVRSQAAMLERLGAAGAKMSPAQLRSVYESQYRKTAEWLREREAFRVIDVNYNDLVADPAPVVARVVEFLGGELDAGAMIAAIDPGLYRQRGDGG